MTERRPGMPPPPAPQDGDYDDPVTVVEWGVMLPDGQLARLFGEHIARLTIENQPARALRLVYREVTYDVWHVASTGSEHVEDRRA